MLVDGCQSPCVCLSFKGKGGEGRGGERAAWAAAGEVEACGVHAGSDKHSDTLILSYPIYSTPFSPSCALFFPPFLSVFFLSSLSFSLAHSASLHLSVSALPLVPFLSLLASNSLHPLFYVSLCVFSLSGFLLSCTILLS